MYPLVSCSKLLKQLSYYVTYTKETAKNFLTAVYHFLHYIASCFFRKKYTNEFLQIFYFRFLLHHIDFIQFKWCSILSILRPVNKFVRFLVCFSSFSRIIKWIEIVARNEKLVSEYKVKAFTNWISLWKALAYDFS